MRRLKESFKFQYTQEGRSQQIFAQSFSFASIFFSCTHTGCTSAFLFPPSSPLFPPPHLRLFGPGVSPFQDEIEMKRWVSAIPPYVYIYMHIHIYIYIYARIYESAHASTLCRFCAFIWKRGATGSLLAFSTVCFPLKAGLPTTW